MIRFRSILGRYELGELNQIEAAEMLGMSERTFRRWCDRLEEEGEAGLLDDGMTCEAVAKVLFLDDDTIRSWYQLYQEDGVEGLASFGYEGSACRLSTEQQERLKTWIAETLPRSTREIGAWIA